MIAFAQKERTRRYVVLGIESTEINLRTEDPTIMLPVITNLSAADEPGRPQGRRRPCQCAKEERRHKRVSCKCRIGITPRISCIESDIKSGPSRHSGGH